MAEKQASFGLKLLSLWTVFYVLLLSGCGTGSNYAPIEDRSKIPFSFNKHHIVSRGETLYSIAWRYDLDARGLAATNHIAAPYLIRPGDKVLLNDQAKVTSAVTGSAPSAVPRLPKASRKSAVASTTKQTVSYKEATSVTLPKGYPFRWQWPAKGRVIKSFRGSAPQHKGIDLHGVLREPVLAANSGTVVYAGSGLAGYGKLIIVKHGESYLSAYAHNSKLLVNEGQLIKVGQKIAEMGDSGTSTNHVKLHFEIRRDGKPVNPESLLPKRR
ncbi:peptidoglycan DD-metalloendopeptidase family protein [Dasania marina]|uniref:peptidoglycan DD-metalloendopeptidase family protein n=1 Tax=Dasania marina TaxID=471499 RepID=UPI0003749D0C|nr:peptidoglycan DD-metalloendopeptidase family protein [Dasania marina]